MEERDFQITAQIRRVLRKRSVDPASVEYGCVDGVVHLRGAVRRLPGAPERLSGPPHLGSFLARLEEDLHRIDGVRSVMVEVDGYKKVGSEWKPAQASHARPARSSST